MENHPGKYTTIRNKLRMQICMKDVIHFFLLICNNE